MKKRYYSVDSNSLSHSLTNSEPPFEYEVESYCPKKKRQVILILRASTQQKGEIVSGKPVHCNLQWICQYDTPPLLNFTDPQCFLNALRIETRRRI